MRVLRATELRRAIRDEEGATATEYGLIVLMVSVAIIGALWVYSESLIDVYASESKAIDDVVSDLE